MAGPSRWQPTATAVVRRPLNIRGYLARMQARGIGADVVLRGTGIDAGQLDDPACVIDASQSQRVIANMIRASGDVALGFSFGRESCITDLGIVGHAVMSARSVRNATALWNQFCGSLLGSLVYPAIGDRADGSWTMTLDCTLPPGLVRLFCLEEMLLMGVGMLRLISGAAPHIEQVRLAYPQPPHAQRYREMLDCPVQFDAPSTQLQIRAPHLDAPLVSNDEEMNEICRRHCRQVMRLIDASRPVSSRLRSLFLRNAGDLPALDDAATALGLSARTLRRRLQEEGTHYQQLRRDFCLDLAREYLSSQQLTPKEVGYLLGFSFPTTFRRAFKTWTGQTVRQYCRTGARVPEQFSANT